MTTRNHLALFLVAAVALALFGCLQSQASGIYGRVILGPNCTPSDYGSKPCVDTPFRATITVMDEDRTNAITSFTSDSDGSFNLTLSPGNYYLVPVNDKSIQQRGEPEFVAVLSGMFTNVTVRYDIGIP